MKRELITLIVLIIAIMLLLPIAQSFNASTLKTIKKGENETVKVVCYVVSPNGDKNRVTDEILRTDYNQIIEMGNSLKNDFQTIYNPDSKEIDVNRAFEKIRPFFTMIVKNQLTHKSVDELEQLYKDIRNIISDKKQKKTGNIQPNGWWNGIWAPMFFNGGCGIIAEAKRCQGFVIGTHSILPGIGFDILLTYFTTDLSAYTETIGVTGWTAAFGPQMAFIINFIGILFGEIPILSYMVFALLIGYAMFYAGASIT
jgi:hypothetical protein